MRSYTYLKCELTDSFHIRYLSIIVKNKMGVCYTFGSLKGPDYMKSTLYILALVALFSCCGNKLYSYRKTVKVTPTPTTNQQKMGVNPNTIYLTTKPVEEKSAEKTLASTKPSSSAMVR
jgi:uncharacterized lipoprotein YajG